MTASQGQPLHIPSWFMGIVYKYVPQNHQVQAVLDYVTEHAKERRPLTPRQREIYDYLKSTIERQGYAPRFEEIAEYCGFQSLATVWEHLDNLTRKGWIERDFGLARAITLTEVNAA